MEAQSWVYLSLKVRTAPRSRSSALVAVSDEFILAAVTSSPFWCGCEAPRRQLLVFSLHPAPGPPLSFFSGAAPTSFLSWGSPPLDPSASSFLALE